MTEDEQAIRNVVETWIAASQAGDTATILSLMTDDVVFTVPGREPFGREVFASASDSLKEMRMEGTSDIVELQILGQWAFIRNHIRIAVTAPGSATQRRSGYTLTLLQKEPDGKWRLARDANMVTEDK
ncbi:SgcJ/EcaC family oxidoreductase [Phyllobacterium sp. TAF24]|uniref:SgcJ/EcaC family oxidoreductase n=1 Tax=Phyllobacterium sp. TAF24 TaxID=3233068 RepID=UPI003F95A286